ncbi:hypothetical protein B0T10DRAFT_564924 [Thelonectria olida]|uniref:Uncharacterized protein n=1 Tax=Thelonectria olida TaxID=1576542 RepID=A0A9P9AKY3_9HYPO|nr:hypothetical protein B0T10DRAFT_564924 [Thelonectria olida]
MGGEKWMNHCISVFLGLASICSLALGIQALSNEQNIKSGIATLQFQLSTNLTDAIHAKRAPQNQDLLNTIQTAADKFPGAASHFESVASAAATSIPNIIKDIPDQVDSIPDLFNGIPELIEELFPKNCSVGTGKFCVGLSSNISCSNLPLNMTDIIPPDILKSLGETFDIIRALDTALTKITAPYFRDTLIVGMVSSFVSVFVLITSLYGWPSCFRGSIVRPGALCAAVYLVFGLILGVPFFIPTIILHILRSKLEQLPSWIQVQQGNVYGLCLGCLCCSLVIVIMGIVTPFVP